MIDPNNASVDDNFEMSGDDDNNDDDNNNNDDEEEGCIMTVMEQINLNPPAEVVYTLERLK
jgi:hypothetical protein